MLVSECDLLVDELRLSKLRLLVDDLKRRRQARAGVDAVALAVALIARLAFADRLGLALADALTAAGRPLIRTGFTLAL